MIVAIIGLGGVGGYYGGKLARYYASHEEIKIVFVARGQHLEQIRAQGLRLITREGDLTAAPFLATDRPEEVGALDLVLFCVKGYDLEEAARMLEGFVGDNSDVLPLMNGVDNAERLKSVLPSGRILNGCVYLSAAIAEPGVIRQTGGTCQLFFGAEEGNTEACSRIDEFFRKAGIDSENRKDIRKVVWEKYIFISPLASVTSLLGKPFGAIMEVKESRNLLEGLTREVELIARAKGVNLPEDIVERSLAKVSIFPYDTKSSMQVDLEKGKKTELETFTGYIARAGEKLGINIPHHQKVYSELIRLCR